MKQAIIAIEDRRFYTNAGVDLRGIGRALWQDVRHQQAVQGGSTITMQFVKNALAAQDDRTLFQKMREAALAYQITRKWSKERILRNYLNTIYFGNGAYGIEAAARVYSANHPGCGDDGKPKCAQMLTPAEAAMIAGMVASPSGYDPLAPAAAPSAPRPHAPAHASTRAITDAAGAEARWSRSRPAGHPAATRTPYPYFTSWVKQQVVDKLGGGQTGARRAFEGGLTVKTTLDSRSRTQPRTSIQWLPAQQGPRGVVVAVKNDTGEVLAMVGGDDYRLAVQSRHAGPASARLGVQTVRARPGADRGVSPGSVWTSQGRHCVARTKKGKCKAIRRQQLRGQLRAACGPSRSATTYSDNAVYAQLGIQIGTKKSPGSRAASASEARLAGTTR